MIKRLISNFFIPVDMVGWFPAILAIAICLLYSIQYSHGCTLDCGQNEKICTCPEGKPKPTPGPSGTTVPVATCDGIYCSVNGVCKPKENGCPAGM